MCHDLFSSARKKDIECPIRIFPKCHKRAHVEVYVDAQKMLIILTCSRCDRPIAKVKVRPK